MEHPRSCSISATCASCSARLRFASALASLGSSPLTPATLAPAKHRQRQAPRMKRLHSQVRGICTHHCCSQLRWLLPLPSPLLGPWRPQASLCHGPAWSPACPNHLSDDDDWCTALASVTCASSASSAPLSTRAAPLSAHLSPHAQRRGHKCRLHRRLGRRRFLVVAHSELHF